jgi:hypothetical protein
MAVSEARKIFSSNTLRITHARALLRTAPRAKIKRNQREAVSFESGYATNHAA